MKQRVAPPVPGPSFRFLTPGLPMSRIAATFEALARKGRKALIPFIVAGDPDAARTVPIMHALVEGGADVIELGIPFSDPMADGPVIQRASERALGHHVSLKTVLGFVAEFRRQDPVTPVVLFGYANPVEAMGIERFADAAQAADADGVLIVDYPPEEARELVALLEARGLDAIFLLSPTTTDTRLRQVAELGRGYLYYVSLKGVTGAAHLDATEVAARIEHVRRFTHLPLGVGFGIRDAQTARAVAEVADAVVIGSALVEVIEQATRDGVAASVVAYLRPIRAALDTLSAARA
jgi:tryptophan synthase alpha chain